MKTTLKTSEDETTLKTSEDETTLKTSEDENYTQNEWRWKLHSKRVKVITRNVSYSLKEEWKNIFFTSHVITIVNTTV